MKKSFCWYWLIRKLNCLIFALTALICCFIFSLIILSLFLRISYFLFSLSLCFFPIVLFSSKIFVKSKSSLSSFNFPSDRLLYQGSFFVFGSLLAPTNSETYAAPANIILFSWVRFQISVLISIHLTLFTAHLTFALGIPHNGFNCSYSFFYT